MRTIWISLCLLTGIYNFSFAQHLYHLTLEESIEIAKSRSYTMQSLQQDLKIADYNLKYATGRLKTSISMNMSLPNYTETIKDWEDSDGLSFYSVKQLGYNGNLYVNQPLPTDGRIYMTNSLSSTNDYNTELRFSSLRTIIGLEQPLDAFYGYNSIRSSLREAKLAYERSNKAYKRSELNLIYNVSSAYFNLLSLQKSLEFAGLDLERQFDAYEISKNKFEAGLIREVEALQMEVELAGAQNNYDIALLNMGSASNSLKELLGLELNDSISLNSQLIYKPVVVDPDVAVQLAMENRLEIREMDIQIELQEMNIKQQRAAGMIKSSIYGHFEKYGYANETNSWGFGKYMDFAYRDLTNRPGSFSVGLTISIPILDWGQNRALVRTAKARQIQNQIQRVELERSIETEVRDMVARLNSSLKRLQLLERNVEVAEKSFDITLQRYSEGDIDSQSLALERDRLNSAYNNNLNAYITYQLALADLMRKTFYDFQRNELIE